MTPAERRTRLTELYAEIRKLKAECPHDIPPQEPDENGYGVAYCEGCGQHFGWYCPSSPDRICHYYSQDGMVVDIHNNQVMPVPEGYSNEYESPDYCIFCGHPDERK